MTDASLARHRHPGGAETRILSWKGETSRFFRAPTPSCRSVVAGADRCFDSRDVSAGNAEIGPGDVLDGKYKILRRVGSGGMGAVFTARRLSLDDTVAIKCMLSAQNTEVNRVRFLREAKAAARIRHPNVVQIFDFGDGPSHPPYMVMEYLQGPTLADEMRRKEKLDPERALEVFGALCAAVEAGHRRGVVHRDLKPGNIILAVGDDRRETVKVLDFGLARFSDSTSLALTQPGALLGTCAYMAPEQIEGINGGPEADVWALAVILYEMVIGALPFQGPTNIATMMKIASGKFNPPRDLAPDLPDAFFEAIESGLTPRPEDRPAGPEALAQLAGAQLGDEAEAVDGDWGAGPLDAVTLAQSNAGSVVPGGHRTIITQAPHSQPDEEIFIGRRPELESLKAEYDSAKREGARVIVITGDAGVGKSALLERFTDWAETKGAMAFRGRFFAYEGDRPPPHETYRWMLSRVESKTSLAAGNMPSDRPEAVVEDRWQAFSGIAAAFAERAGGRPVVLALDDLQWATALDLEFLGYLQRRVVDNTVFIVGTARLASTHNEGLSELGRWMLSLGNQRFLSRIGLDPFTVPEVRAWLTATFGTLRIHPSDVRRLAQITAGNPFYLAEVTKHLIAKELLRREDRGWACERLDEIELPETVNNVVRAKLQDLSEEVRAAVEYASVVGEEFRFETLEEASGRDEEVLENLLEDALKRNVLTDRNLSPGSDYGFVSSTMRDVVYQEMSKRRRKRLHKKVVGAIESLYSANLDRVAKVLCYHYFAIEDWEKTLATGLQAANHIRREDADNARAALDRARRAAEELTNSGHGVDPIDRARLDHMSGEINSRHGRLGLAREQLERAVSLAALEGYEDLRIDAILDLSHCMLSAGAFSEGAEQASKALELALAQGDAPRAALARCRGAAIAAKTGDFEYGRDLLGPVIEQDDPELEDLRALALRELGFIEARRGQFSEARAATEEALAVAKKKRDAMLEYQATSTLAVVLGESGEISEALGLFERALDLARTLSLRWREAVEVGNLAESHLHLNQLDHALARILEALAIAGEIRNESAEGDFSVTLGQILVARKEYEGAIKALQRGYELCAATGRSEYAALALLELGQAKLNIDQPEEALEQLQRAHRALESLGSVYLWKAEFRLGKALLHTDREAARKHVERAAELLQTQLGQLADHTSSGLNSSLRDVVRMLRELEKKDSAS